MSKEQQDQLSPSGEQSKEGSHRVTEQHNRGYVTLTLRIRRWVLLAAILCVAAAYVLAMFWTGYTMRMFSETSGPPKSYEMKVIKYGCVEKLGNEYKVPHELSSELRRSRIYRLDDTYVAHNDQGILEDPLCLGASISDLMHKPGPVRYYVVDAASKNVLLEVIKREH